MAPNANSRCVGDFSVVQPTNTSLYGYGDLSSRDVKPYRNLELNATTGIPEIKTTTLDLKVTSAKGLDVQSAMAISLFFPRTWLRLVRGRWVLRPVGRELWLPARSVFP